MSAPDIIDRQNAPSPLRALWAREWRAGSRLARTPWLLCGAGLVMTAILLLVALPSSSPAGDVGRKLFQVCFSLGIVSVTLFGPAIAANAIALEREGKTWEALVMAGLTPRAIDRGKFLGAYTHLVLYVLALLPCAGIAHAFGGVTVTETVLGIVMVLVLGALSVRFGLAVSAMVPSTRAALLVTLGASAVLCWFTVVGGFVVGQVLRHGESAMASLDDGPVFWPVALVHEPFGFVYARYLVVIPVTAALIGWFSLRELTVYALGATGRQRPRRVTYVAIMTALAVALGLLPQREGEIVISEIGFTMCTFGAIIVVAGGDPGGSQRTTLGRSLLLVLVGAGGIFLTFGVAWMVLLFTNPYIELRREISNMLVYGPAFTVFVVGLGSLSRTLIRSGKIRRAVAAGVTFAVSVAPIMLTAFLQAAGASYRWALAMSPFGVLASDVEGSHLCLAAGLWAMLGVALLAWTHRRELRR